MIYAATFLGRNLNALGVSHPQSTHCYGENEEQARINLYDRFEHISQLRLSPRPIVKVGDTKPGDRFYRVEDGKLIGHINPHESAYKVEPRSEIICSGEYANHITCRNSAGILCPVAPDLDCIVTPA